jgi:hypothetical protein
MMHVGRPCVDAKCESESIYDAERTHSFTVVTAASGSSATFGRMVAQWIHTFQARGTGNSSHATSTLCPRDASDANATTIRSTTMGTTLVIVALGIDAFETIGTGQAGKSTTKFYRIRARHLDTNSGTIGGTATIRVTVIVGIIDTSQIHQVVGLWTFKAAKATAKNLGAYANGGTSTKGAIVGGIVDTNSTIVDCFAIRTGWW